ncbi:hypothetical protein Goshw_000687, partial [Gossypium schwendimanii]|nr:hypothetical protein [Gossypium schwendimanii]
FKLTSYEDLAIQAVIPEEFFVNPNAWNVKVPLVVYATINIHETDRVLQQFRFRQLIPMAPQDLDDLHHIDLRRSDENWSIFHSQVNMWNDRYVLLSTRKPIIITELACDLEYMPWFKIHGKPYLYREEARSRHPHRSRPRRPPLNPRAGEAGPSSTPTLDYWSSIPDILHVRTILFPDDDV